MSIDPESRDVMSGHRIPDGGQRTLRSSIGCVGIGLHSGVKVALSLHPAPAGTGIRFLRKDQADQAPIRALFDQVCDTTMCTTIGKAGQSRISTIEHLMAAFAALDIDNARVEVHGPEVPIMDGSSQPFIFLIECAGIVEQGVPRRWVEVLKPVTVTAHGKQASVEPLATDVTLGHLTIDCSIEFDHPIIKSQSMAITLTADRFKKDIAGARTFGFAERVEELWSRGLALGGSLKNAVVVSQDKVLNDGGLRFEDEFVRHKVLDSIGDLYLAGGPMMGRFTGHCAGHAMHNKLLRALFADPSAWRWVEGSMADETHLEIRKAAGA